MRQMRWVKQQQGMTLVEVVLALVVLSLVMAGSYLLVSRAAATSRAARDHYVAAVIAKDRLERARNFAYDDLHLLAEDDVVVDDTGLPDPEGNFRRTTIVNTNYASGLTKIEVIVEVRNQRTGDFTGGQESVASLFTEYYEREE